MTFKKTFSHRGYDGSAELSIEDGCLHGEILHISDSVSYEGATVQEIQAAFVEAVEDYISTCEEIGKSPDKPVVTI